jgi:hypothetical protein
MDTEREDADGDDAVGGAAFVRRLRGGADTGVARWWLRTDTLCVLPGGTFLAEIERETVSLTLGTSTEKVAVGMRFTALGEGVRGAESGDEGGVGVAALRNEGFDFTADCFLGGSEAGVRTALMIF